MTVAGAVPADTPRTAAVVGPVGLAAALDGLLLIVGERLPSDPDTYWHIETGRWVCARGGADDRSVLAHATGCTLACP